ncbi:hypothetical protein I302_108064 [Kwoniella bestiolae CBS 10118]|uniref:Palmitoyltransferase n=1 Tax=Kwoniella bestiolae CBS 10118 TaxID=1296100 RepID=A0A1B9FWS0_9TREE|nr:hypothetical protein I302_07570 [Kwoniella bestiolae CBS 10118]OCF23216.1 hypothetical protein I302_07570 [Kwoniella bestiolae CBS 10118]
MISMTESLLLGSTRHYAYLSQSDMGNSPTWLLQQLIPPLLLTYFYFAWKISTFEMGPRLIEEAHIHSWLALPGLYLLFPTLSILPITVLYLRLYLLPSSQSVPPLDPPSSVQNRQIIFQCLSPAEAKAIRLADNEEHDDDDPMVERCYRGRCGGRWKPARARHCTLCKRCRAGWDHHCVFFANCLSAPYMRTFLALLLYTPPTILIISLPLYKPLLRRAKEAYTYSRADEGIRRRWWEWGYSWVIAGGPIGRYAGGIILGWRELDRMDEGRGGLMRLNVGLMVGFGIVLALITAGLAFTTLSLILKGNLTIDRGRSSAHAQALNAIHKLKIQKKHIPSQLEKNLSRFSDKRWFFIPLPEELQTSEKKGIVIPTLDRERPYDHGWKKNIEIVLGSTVSWILPWNAIRRGMGDEVFLWPISEDVETRLREEAERRARGSIAECTSVHHS